MDNQNKKTNDCCINGIDCAVTNCIHNNHHCGCTAGHIKVGPTYATTCSDTVCQSFKEQCK